MTHAPQRLLSLKNVISVLYSDVDNNSIGRHEGSAQIYYLNATVYTYWSNRRVVPFLGKFIDFVLHKRSIAGTSPNKESRAYDACLTREILTKEITALKNQLTPRPSLTQMEVAMQEVEARIGAQLEEMQQNINSNTTQIVDESATATTNRQELILR